MKKIIHYTSQHLEISREDILVRIHLENGQLFLKKKLLQYEIFKIIKQNNQNHPLSVLIYTYKSRYYFSFSKLYLEI